MLSGSGFRPLRRARHEWAEQVRLDDGVCPDIDGTYRNAGERFDFDTHNRRIVSLAHLLNGGFSADAFQADDCLGATALTAADDPHQTVTLRLEENALHVRGGTRGRRCQDLRPARATALQGFSPLY